MNYKIISTNFFSIIFCIILGILTLGMNIGLISTSSVLISKSFIETDISSLMVLIVLVRFFGIFRGIFRYLERIYSHNMALKHLSKLRTFYYSFFNDRFTKTFKFFKNNQIYSDLIYSLDTFKDFFLRFLIPVLVSIFTGILMSYFLETFYPSIGFLFLFSYFFIGFFIPLIEYFIRKKLKYNKLILQSSIDHILMESINGVIEKEIFNLQSYFFNKMLKYQNNLSLFELKETFLKLFFEFLTKIFYFFSICYSLYKGINLYQNHNIHIVFIAMIPLSFLAAFEALAPLSNSISYLDSFLENLNKIKPLFKIQPYNDDFFNLTNSNNHLFVNNLSIKNILKPITIDLTAGKKIAIVGESGSGKSSILNALFGFLDFTCEDIKWNESSISSTSISSLRPFISFCNQDGFLFNTTFEENLRLANSDASDEMISSLKKDFFIKDSLNSEIGENSFLKSAGQVQRILLARTFLKNSPIVFLDEPTSHMDYSLEQSVTLSIHKNLLNKSCIWVTHRLIKMDLMDEIIVLKNGSVIERGDHFSLLENKGYYYKIWHIQNDFNF